MPASRTSRGATMESMLCWHHQNLPQASPSRSLGSVTVVTISACELGRDGWCLALCT